MFSLERYNESMTTATRSPTPPAVLTRRQAAEMLSIRPSTLQRWLVADRGPKAIRLGLGSRGRVLYARAELERFIAAGMPLHEPGARPAGSPPKYPAPRRRHPEEPTS